MTAGEITDSIHCIGAPITNAIQELLPGSKRANALACLASMPASLIPLVALDLLDASRYATRTTARQNLAKTIRRLRKTAFGHSLKKASSPDISKIVVKALPIFKRRGLGAALGLIFRLSETRGQQSKAIEHLADAVLPDLSAYTRARWIAYAIRPQPHRAEKSARKLFKYGNISSAIALLKLSGTHSIDRKLGELRLSASLLMNGIKLPSRSSNRLESGPNHIAYVAASALPYKMSGYTVRTHGLLKALKTAGVNIRCYTRPGFPWDQPYLSYKDGFDLHAELDRVEYISTRIDDLTNEPELFVERMSQALEQRFLVDKPQIIHAASNHRNALPALIAARRLGVPFFYEIRGLWELSAATKKGGWETTERFNLERSLEIFVARESDQVFTITRGLAEELISGGIREEKIAVLPNAVDPDFFKPMEKNPQLAREVGISAGDFVLVYVGSFTVYEGLDDLIAAIRVLRDRRVAAKLILLGGGRMEENLRSLVRELDVENQVKFCGIVPHECARDYLSLADVVALPRKPFKVCEIVTPLKPFEAMAMAKPVVLTDLPALREIVGDGRTGLLCAPGDPVSLAGVLQQLADSVELRVRLGRAAREWVVQNRSWAANARIVKEYYTSFTTEPYRQPNIESA